MLRRIKLFKSYPSITNSYSDKFLMAVKAFIQMQELDVDWYVTEKIHGANAQFSCDITTGEKTVRFGKRSAFIEESESGFYGHKRVVARYEDSIKSLFDLVNKAYDNKVTQMIIYGELFGGHYPGVKNDNNSKKVQDGVFYCPHNEFFAFDLAVRMEKDEEFKYVNHLVMNTALKSVDIPGVPVLKTGSLNECLAYPNEFVTTIPQMFDLPEIDDNICEGVVIKPSKALWLPDGKRVIFKNKNEKFTEKAHKPRVPKEPPELDDKAQEVLNGMLAYLNENRVIAVISKHGEPEFKKFGDYLKELNNEIVVEFDEENDSKFKSLSKDRRKMVTKSLNKLSSGLVREYLKKST